MFVKNKRKQKKLLKRLIKLSEEYNKWYTVDYSKAKEIYYKCPEQSEFLDFSSEEIERFKDRKTKKLEIVLTEYNKLNEKLPIHIRLDVLD